MQRLILVLALAACGSNPATRAPVVTSASLPDCRRAPEPLQPVDVTTRLVPDRPLVYEVRGQATVTGEGVPDGAESKTHNVALSVLLEQTPRGLVSLSMREDAAGTYASIDGVWAPAALMRALLPEADQLGVENQTREQDVPLSDTMDLNLPLSLLRVTLRDQQRLVSRRDTTPQSMSNGPSG